MTYKKMDPKVKEKWVKALRSGRYKQAAGTLMTDDGKAYCCLGVLATCTRVAKTGDYGDLYFNNPATGGNIEGEGELPDFILEKFNLSVAAQTKLIKLNDGERDSWIGAEPGDEPANDFNHIADFIEKNL